MGCLLFFRILFRRHILITFYTYEQQIELLRQKGLSVPDPAHAKQVLAHIGYYELVNGYKTPYKESGRNGNFRKGVDFDDLVALYKLDENLRELFLKYILRIEIHMRSLLSYAFCKKYGASQKDYCDPDHYTHEKTMLDEVRRLTSELEGLASRSMGVATYVQHYRLHYGDVPLWVLFKTTSLGTLNRFFDCCDPTVQKRVTDVFPSLRRDTLAKMLDVMNKFRNVCAHNDCLYAFRSPTGIPPMPELRNFNIPAFAKGSREEYGGNDLFSMLIIFSYLLTDADFEKCLVSLKNMLDHFFGVCKTLPPEKLYRAMGFPLDGDLTLSHFQ